MKTIYYVIQKHINSYDEATGTKEVRAYELKEGKMSSICEIEIDNTENSEKSLLVELEKKNLIQTHVHLIEL
jgi:hypothetical protein